MPKHRGSILEHQTSTPSSLSDFSMENATNSSNLRLCSAASRVQPLQAMVDPGLELGNQRILGQRPAWEEASFFKISVNQCQLVPFIITRVVG
jgi:hypothetical protein